MITFKRPRGVMDNASVWRARGPEIESHNGQEFVILKFSVVRHTDNFRFDERHCIGDLMARAMIRKLLYSEFDR